MNVRASLLAGDASWAPASETRLTVGRDGKLEHDMRATILHAADVPRMRSARFFRADTKLDRNSMLAQACKPLPRHLGIGILKGGDHPRDAGGNQGVGARRRLAVMRTGLKRGVEDGAFGSRAG